MYKVYYRYRVRVDGCGCCSYSKNELVIEELESGKLVEDRDNADTICYEQELIDYVSEVYSIPKDKIVVDKDSEYL